MLYSTLENWAVNINSNRHVEKVIKGYLIYLASIAGQNRVIPECDCISAVMLLVKIVMDQLDLWYNHMVLNSVQYS